MLCKVDKRLLHLDLSLLMLNKCIHDIFDYLCFLQSLITLGAMFGSIIGGWAIDYFGRKGTIMMCSLPFELGWFLIAFAKNHEMLYRQQRISQKGVFP